MFRKVNAKRLTGDEPLHSEHVRYEISAIDFWRWSSSDLLSNATRGIFAEFIVTYALCGSVDGVRTEWDAYDVLTPEGIKVEVKSAAYIQSWAQAKPSAISFGIQPTRAWHAEANAYDIEFRRQADVYVFALLFHADQNTIDPLNLDQWKFYVVPTTVLNAYCPGQKRISLHALESIAGVAVGFDELRDAVGSTLSG